MMKLHKFYIVYQLFLIIGIMQILPAEEPDSSCSHINITQGTDYCDVPENDISCHVQTSINYALQKNMVSHHLPQIFWVQLCFFAVPLQFANNKDEYNCIIEVDNGPVSCTANSISSSVNNFTSNCNFAIVWHQQLIQNTTNHFRCLPVDSGQCANFYENLWTNNDNLYVSERWLFQEGISFSKKENWMKVEKCRRNVSGPDMSQSQLNETIGIAIGVLILACIITVTIYATRKWWKYERNLKIRFERISEQLTFVFESSEPLHQQADYNVEIPDILQYNSA